MMIMTSQKVSRSNITLFLILLISISNVYAQVSQKTATATSQRYIPKPIKTRVQLRVDSLQALTTPGYYKARNTPIGKNKGELQFSGLRTNECESYLCVGKSLPVTLVSFKGSRLSATEVKLQWETSMETNNAGFEIGRSIEGTGDFQVVARIDGAGTTSENNKYATIDFNTDSDVSYYRLKQMDYDGQFTYSRVISVEGFREKLFVTSNPNPGPQADVYFQVKGATVKTVDLAVYSVAGTVVFSDHAYQLGGSNRIVLKTIARLKAGSYVLKVKSGEDNSIVSFVILD